MRIGIDLTSLAPVHVGADRYLTNLVRAFSTPERPHEFFLFVNTADRRLFAGQLPANFRVVPLSWRSRPIRLLLQQLVLPAAARLLRLDVLHSPSYILPFFLRSARHVLSVHDLTVMTHPQCHTAVRRSKAFSFAVRRSLERADVVCVPSGHVQSEIRRLTPSVSADRVRVTPYGVCEQFHPQAGLDAPVLAQLGLATPPILFVGTLEPRKNLLHLLRSYRRLIEEHDVKEHLVVAGKPGWGFERFLAEAASPALRERVHVLGYVREEELPALIAGSALFVYPSLQEGFGFPPLEAMAAGVPVIASDTSSLAEILDGAACLVPPHDEEGLRDAMHRLLEDETLRARYADLGAERASHYRWEATAEQVLSCYEEAMRTARPRPAA